MSSDTASVAGYLVCITLSLDYSFNKQSVSSGPRAALGVGDAKIIRAWLATSRKLRLLRRRTFWSVPEAIAPLFMTKREVVSLNNHRV